jgi:hypothetical protein
VNPIESVEPVRAHETRAGQGCHQALSGAATTNGDQMNVLPSDRQAAIDALLARATRMTVAEAATVADAVRTLSNADTDRLDRLAEEAARAHGRADALTDGTIPADLLQAITQAAQQAAEDPFDALWEDVATGVALAVCGIAVADIVPDVADALLQPVACLGVRA